MQNRKKFLEKLLKHSLEQRDFWAQAILDWEESFGEVCSQYDRVEADVARYRAELVILDQEQSANG